MKEKKIHVTIEKVDKMKYEDMKKVLEVNEKQFCTFCLKNDSIISKETCCTGCSKLEEK